ncbi:MAG: diadenylate cyclase CdaA [Lachnospiraceae bacterium]|nr:diadenylate cyclase CdaA [Lachnospiraceae bacterium]
MELIHEFLENLHIPTVNVLDVVEILIIAVLMYVALVWVKETHAWALFRGVMVIAIFVAIAALLNMNTIIWIARQLVSIFLMVMVVVLQPELRKALESLGQKNFFSQILPFDSRKQEAGFTDRTIAEIVKACVEMGKARTGALIVIENKESLAEYERTGIDVDGVVSSQLLINIFEKNTPLHDGAVVVRGDRITSATCYLPLSDNRTISKELGTRHRAGLGIAEATDSMTVIVSEETGRISVAFMGQLYHGLSADELKEQLGRLQDKAAEEKKRFLWRGRSK